jgi:hypothetical protein
MRRVVDPDVLADITAKDKEIESLKAQIDRYTRVSESGVSLGDSIDAALYITELEAQLAECRDKALEEAAHTVEYRGKQIGGAIRPGRTAEAIRSLKGAKP